VPKNPDITEAHAPTRPDAKVPMPAQARPIRPGREVCEACGEYMDPAHRQRGGKRTDDVDAATVHECPNCHWGFGRERRSA
jgi:hypothetical protein